MRWSISFFFTLSLLAHPLLAQDAAADSLLVPGALVRIWEGAANGYVLSAQVVERRGDSLVVKRDAITSGGVMVQRPETRTLAWRTLTRLDVRGARVKDSPIEGGVIGLFVGMILGSFAGSSTSSDVDLSSASGSSLGPMLFGGLGLLIGLGIDAAKDNSPWVTVVPVTTP